ncbi:MAG: DEAD/DEAH box helicase, partial [Alphaproteobacteria bacterium]|nr:DEAD/DEAH box helicase [Alphaproteobacteria bacterium]
MRPDILKPLFDPVTTLKGVGDNARHALTRLGCERIRDLLFHLPAHYLDRRYAPAIFEAEPGKVATFLVTVESHQQPARGSKAPYKVVCGNETGSLQLLYFKGNAAAVKNMLVTGRRYVVSGKTDRFDGILQMAHPDIVAPPDQWNAVCRLEPQYPLTYALSNRVLARLIQAALARMPVLPEWADAAFLERRKWPAWEQALRILHAPADDAPETLEPLRTRLAYDEILAGQLALAMVRKNAKAKPGIPLTPGALREKALKQLPFQLTEGQRQVLAEIDADLASGERMMRLLQGDVGSGKTALALLAMLSAVEQGFQAAIMAPTEILARQHLHWIESQLAPLGVQTAILTGREKGKKREELLARLAGGQTQVVIGTHALFQDDVVFHNLGLAVVDEQHRFGVMQRLRLGDKGRHPHVLMMTATPIPRSLTLAAFGDMDCSRLTEKPPGRKPVDTRAVPSGRMDDVVEGLRRLLDG